MALLSPAWAGTARDDTSTAVTGTQPPCAHPGPPGYAGSVAPSALRLAVWPGRSTLDGGPLRALKGHAPAQPPSPHCWPLRLICGAHCTRCPGGYPRALSGLGGSEPKPQAHGTTCDRPCLNEQEGSWQLGSQPPMVTVAQCISIASSKLKPLTKSKVRTSGRKDSYGGNEDREPGRSLERRIGELRVRVVRVHNKRVGAHPVRPNAAENLWNRQ